MWGRRRRRATEELLVRAMKKSPQEKRVRFSITLLENQRSSSVCGKAWRKQQKQLIKQHKLDQREKEKWLQFKNAYDLLLLPQKKEKLLQHAAAANDDRESRDFAKRLNSFFMAAGAAANHDDDKNGDGSASLRYKLEWFQKCYRGQEFNQEFLDREYVHAVLTDLCLDSIYVRHFRRGPRAFNPPASSWEESGERPILDSEQRSSVLAIAAPGLHDIVMGPFFASPAAAPPTLRLGAEHSVLGPNGSHKMHAAASSKMPDEDGPTKKNKTEGLTDESEKESPKKDGDGVVNAATVAAADHDGNGSHKKRAAASSKMPDDGPNTKKNKTEGSTDESEKESPKKDGE